MKSGILVGIACVLSISVQPAKGRVRVVPDAYETIQTAVNVAFPGDTVLLMPGIYHECIEIDRGLVMTSLFMFDRDAGYVESTIIDGSANGTVVALDGEDSAFFCGFTIRNGENDEGGGIRAYAGSLRLDDMAILSNGASSRGGGLDAVARIYMNRCLIEDNSSGGQAGGFSLNRGGELRQCIIKNNRAQDGDGAGTLFVVSGSFLYQVAIIENQSATGAAGMSCHSWNGTTLMENVTIARNRSNDQNPLSMRFTARPERMFHLFNNSICYDNFGARIGLIASADRWSVVYFYALYNDIEGGEDGFYHQDSVVLRFLDGNFDADPRFVDPDRGDYRLREDSPCIDAGDQVEGGWREPGRDTAQIDLGAYPLGGWPVFPSAYAGGQVIDLETGNPVDSVLVTADIYPYYTYSEYTNGDGYWGKRFYLKDDSVTVQFSFSLSDYIPFTLAHQIIWGDSVSFIDTLTYAELEMHPDRITAVFEQDTITTRLRIENTGNGTLTWMSSARMSGIVGDPPWTLRQSLPVGQIADDPTIRAAAFTGEQFLVAGSNENSQTRRGVAALEREGITDSGKAATPARPLHSPFEIVAI